MYCEYFGQCRDNRNFYYFQKVHTNLGLTQKPFNNGHDIKHFNFSHYSTHFIQTLVKLTAVFPPQLLLLQRPRIRCGVKTSSQPLGPCTHYSQYTILPSNDIQFLVWKKCPCIVHSAHVVFLVPLHHMVFCRRRKNVSSVPLQNHTQNNITMVTAAHLVVSECCPVLLGVVAWLVVPVPFVHLHHQNCHVHNVRYLYSVFQYPI